MASHDPSSLPSSDSKISPVDSVMSGHAVTPTDVQDVDLDSRKLVSTSEEKE